MTKDGGRGAHKGPLIGIWEFNGKGGSLTTGKAGPLVAALERLGLMPPLLRGCCRPFGLCAACGA